eukprot:CAMPEP_0119003472 /NCGR_PEP_ID=MMETSP1176-20130426/582_1 /TAXON_ID=265551 /ORGANISM="Synedropsis recta cf, Strain CCMP1620" /LENGTH=204 /DNA_ID=CAMNT_0006955081 /DNA_START=14 /DNA_END=624 /DNA_ORIENTATION=+
MASFLYAFLFLVLLAAAVPTTSLSSPRVSNLDRRRVLNQISGLLPVLLAPVASSQAACLQGDTSPDCIGYYKVPLDDAILPYIGSPEKLEQFAPGVRWVPPIEYPKNYKDATAELEPLRKKCAALNDIILAGNLTQAGIEVLGILPRITVAGRVIVKSLSESKSTSSADVGLRALRVESAYTDLTSKLNSMDIMIGQGIRGDLG